MSDFQDKLIKHIEDNPDFITPAQYRNETLGFLKEPLQDMCVSRSIERLTWGVEIPFDKEFVTYVWFDALLNYCSALGYKGAEKFEKFWPDVHHLLAKDIVKTHCVYWPTMLMALDIPLPKRFLVHGYWLTGDHKISKSLETDEVFVPLELKDKVGPDPLRFFLASAMSFGRDASFTEEVFKEKYNADLANNIGNLISRSTNLVAKNFDGKLPGSTFTEVEERLFSDLTLAWEALLQHIQNFELNKAADKIPAMGRLVNKYIDDHEPWKMVKDEAQRDDAGRVLRAMCESIRFIAGAACGFMPDISAKMLESLGQEPVKDLGFFVLGDMAEGTSITKCPPLFPRL